MEKLLPCPFCGSPAKLGHLKVDQHGDIRLVVECQGIGCWANIQEYVGDEQSATRVVAAWNRRTPATEPVLDTIDFEAKTSGNVKAPASGLVHIIYVIVGRLEPDEMEGLSSKIKLTCTCGWERKCGYNLQIDELKSFADAHLSNLEPTP